MAELARADCPVSTGKLRVSGKAAHAEVEGSTVQAWTVATAPHALVL